MQAQYLGNCVTQFSVPATNKKKMARTEDGHTRITNSALNYNC